MFKTKILLVAKKFLTDSKAGSLSAIEIIEDITAQSFPYVIPNFGILLSLEKDTSDPDEKEGNLTIKVDDQTLVNQIETFRFNGKNRKNTIFNAKNIIIPQPGKVTVNVSLDDGVASEYSLIVKLNPTEEVVTESEV